MAGTAAELGKEYLDALQAKNRDWLVSLLAEDFTLEIPCNVAGTNDRSDSWSGRDKAPDTYDLYFRTIDVIKYVDLEITAGKDDNVAFAEGLGVMKMVNGRPYENRYIFRFDVESGKIKRIREYLNPVTSAVAFGIPLPKQYA
jgi:ketosteroid isomerase-like protein